MSMKELLAEKHPTAWAEFEKGLIDEVFSVTLDGKECVSKKIIDLLFAFVSAFS